MFSGYVFWLILSKFTTPDVIGTAATIVSVCGIFITISGMAIHNGLQRFLGKSFARHENANALVLVKSSILLITVGIAASSVFILIAQNWFFEYFAGDINLIFIVIILIGSTCYYTLLRSAIIASFKTKMLPLVIGISTIVKILLAVVLINFGAGAFGVLVGFTSFDILASIFLAIILLQIIKTQKSPNLGIVESIRRLLPASVVMWIPALVTAFGTHLGTIVVFGSYGASQAGVYFIAFSITTAIWVLAIAPQGIAFPKLSGMVDGRKRYAWGITKISLAVFSPLFSSIIFYSEETLLLLGESYVQGSFTLGILLISVFPLTLMSGIRTLTYAYGNYNHVLVIGAAMSIPRILLYIILVPIMGGVGAGISFTVGSLIGFVASIIISKKICFKIFWKDLALILAIPIGLSLTLSYFEISSIIGISVTILLSYILFLKMRIITKNEWEYSIEVLPKKLGQPTLNFINKLEKKLNHSYKENSNKT